MRAAHTSGGPTIGEAVDELGVERRGVRRLVAQVLVAVVGTTDFGDDVAVGVGQAGTRGAGHRREVGERRDRAADEVARRVEVGMAADVHVRAERDLGGIASVVGRGLAREVDRPGDAIGIGADRERHALGDRAPRTRSCADPTPRCRAAPSAAGTGRGTATGSDDRSQSIVSLARYAWRSVTVSMNSTTGIGFRPRWKSAVSPRPMPSTNRPPDVSCTVAATFASAAGWRVIGVGDAGRETQALGRGRRERDRDERIAHQVLRVGERDAVPAELLGPFGLGDDGPDLGNPHRPKFHIQGA